jgi:hypothetical protein
MEDFIEVHLWGEAHESEVVAILRKLHEMAPRKEISDLWLFAEEYVISWDTFSEIVKEVTQLLPHDMIASKSAIVVANHFQMAQASLYLEEAKRLPFEIGVFMTREEAIRWLKK